MTDIALPAELQALFETYDVDFSDTLAVSQSVYSLKPTPEIDFGGGALSASVATVQLNAREGTRLKAYLENARRYNNALLLPPPANTMNFGTYSADTITIAAPVTAGGTLVGVSGGAGLTIAAGAFVSTPSNTLHMVLEDCTLTGGTGELLLFPRIVSTLNAGQVLGINEGVLARWKPVDSTRSLSVSGNNKMRLSFKLLALT